MSKSNSDELDRILWGLTDQSAWDLSGITQKQSDDLSETLSADRIEAKELIEAEYSKREQALADLIIGEDETYEGHQMVWSIEHRNQLRAEQRKHLVNVQEIRHELRRQTLHTS